MAIRQISIIGTGLLGGSLGLALKKRKFAGRIVGCDRDAVLVKVEDACETKPFWNVCSPVHVLAEPRSCALVSRGIPIEDHQSPN